MNKQKVFYKGEYEIDSIYNEETGDYDLGFNTDDECFLLSDFIVNNDKTFHADLGLTYFSCYSIILSEDNSKVKLFLRSF